MKILNTNPALLLFAILIVLCAIGLAVAALADPALVPRI